MAPTPPRRQTRGPFDSGRPSPTCAQGGRQAGLRWAYLALLAALALSGCASVEGALKRDDLAGACRLQQEPPGTLSLRDPAREQQALRDAFRQHLQVSTEPLSAEELRALLGHAPARPLDLRRLTIHTDAALRARVVQAGFVGAPVKVDDELLAALGRADAERLTQEVEAHLALDEAMPPLPKPVEPKPVQAQAERVSPPLPEGPSVGARAAGAVASVAAQVALLPVCILASILARDPGACRVEVPPMPPPQPRPSERSPAPAERKPDPAEEARYARLKLVVDQLFAPCEARPGASCRTLYLARQPGPQTVSLEVTLLSEGEPCVQTVVVPLGGGEEVPPPSRQ